MRSIWCCSTSLCRAATALGVLEILRRTHSTTDLPVIMTTAKDKSEDVVAALAMGRMIT